MGMGTTRSAAAGVAGVLAGAALFAGCSVPGTGSADPSDVAAYETTIAASRAAAAATARTTACTAWTTNINVRLVASRATAAYTKTPGWKWDGITPLVNAELAAIATESGKLPGIIATPNLAPTLTTLFTDYKAKLDAYATGLRADSQARGTEEQTWPKRNAAVTPLIDAETATSKACPSS